MKKIENKAGRLSSGEAQLLRLVLISLFAALSFVILIVFRIPYPAPVGSPFLHFGNAVVILAALLLGGWQGGLAGSIGMGLNDVVYGYGFYAIETVILKFGIGLFTGLVARVGIRHPERNPRTGLGIASGLSLLFGGILLAGKLFGWSGFEKFANLAYIFLLSLGVLLAAATVLAVRSLVTNEVLFAVLGAVTGIAWNVFGEFAGGTIMAMLSGAQWQAAMIASLLSLPATFINGAFSIVVAVLIYVPLRKALQRAHLDAVLVK